MFALEYREIRGRIKQDSPLARCVAGCWGGGHVKWCHEVAKPRRNGSGKIPATATIFENHNFYLKVFQNFEIKKQGNGDLVTQIVAVPEAAKSDTSYMILIFLFFHFFHFFTNFKKQKVPEIRGPILLPSRRRQKATHPI